MSGVIDEDGTQWERCNFCTKFTRIQDLGYQLPSKNHPYGKDICRKCTNKLPQEELEEIKPASTWIPQYENSYLVHFIISTHP